MRLVIILVLLGVFLGVGDITLKTLIDRGSSAALILSGVDRASLEETIVEYYRVTVLHDEQALRDPQAYTLTSTYTDLNSDGRSDVIAQIESERTCGTGGCIVTIFVQNESRGFDPVPFEYAVHSIEPVENITNGMRDLRINNDSGSTMSWDGSTYVLNFM